MKDILLHFLSFSFLRLVFFSMFLFLSILESDFDNDDDDRYKFVTFSAIFLLNLIESSFYIIIENDNELLSFFIHF